MTGRRLNFARPTLSIAAAVLTALVIFGRLPGDTRLVASLQDTAHAPVFFLLALIFVQLFVRRRYLASFAVCVLLGVAIEGVQACIGGDVSIKDVWTDALGAIAGLSAYAYVHSERNGTALIALCISCVLVACAPLGWTLAAYCNRAIQFPAVARFDSALDLYFLRARVPPPELSSGHSLLVRLGHEAWPGIAIEEPSPDWSGYRTLNVEVFNPGSTALPLTLRVHDKIHSLVTSDRFNMRFEVPAGSNKRLRISLSRIQAAPATRQMDLTRIAGLTIYGTQSLAGKAFYLGGIWLE